MVWPGLAVLITTLAFNLLGDGLRDAFDPRSGEIGGRDFGISVSQGALRVGPAMASGEPCG